MKRQVELTQLKELGARLRSERKRLRLTQAEFAALGGVELNSQSSYERGERKPDAGYLLLVASGDVDVLFVLTGRRHIESYGFAEEGRPFVEHPAALQGLTLAERDLLAAYRDLSDPDKEVLKRTAHVLRMASNRA